MPKPNERDLRETFLTPLRKCADYKPAFGQEGDDGLSLSEFQDLYSQDQFYAWLGLNDPMVYAAHKAAGGLTSVYRQLGIGCERLFRSVLSQELGLDENQLRWEYEYAKTERIQGKHILDARILLGDLDKDAAGRFSKWLKSVHASLKLRASANLDGVVFEVRQGYKSADSKRQNADLRFGLNAFKEGLLPVFALMSSQVSEVVARRYRADGMLVLKGTTSSDPTISTFAFFKQVIGYDLAAFFERNSSQIQAEVKKVVIKLLAPDA